MTKCEHTWEDPCGDFSACTKCHATGEDLLKEIAELKAENAILKLRIATAKELAGHKSLDSRRELLEILEGNENNP